MNKPFKPDEDINIFYSVFCLHQAASLAIPKIGCIHKYIDRPTAERLVHALETARLDEKNSLLCGLPDSAISNLQRLQNGAVRLVLSIKGRHVDIDTLLRKELHWLSVRL